MKTSYFKLTSLLVMLMLAMGTASASFTVSVGQHSTLTFNVNASDTTTVTLIKCEGGKYVGVPMHGGMFLGDDIVEIPDVVTVNGVEKTVTIIGDNSSAHVPVFWYVKKVVFPATTKIIKKYSLVYEQGEYLPSTYCTFDFSKTASLETFEPDFGTVPNYSYGYDLPYIENLTIRNGVKLSEKFPFDKAVNLTFDESSTVYDLHGGCLMRKGDNETVVTILRLPEVTVPATVKRIAHHMPCYNNEEKTHITFEAGSQLTTINGSLNYCIFDEWPSTVTTVDWPWASKGFTGSEFLTFVLPANHASFQSNPFAGAIFHHFEWGENPTLKPYLFSNCTFMEDLEVPDGMTKTNGAFRFATFNGKFELPETLKSLVWSEFSHCYFSKELFIPYNINKLPNSCFTGSRFGGELLLPENALVMGDSCFYNCTFDKCLVLPDGVSEMSKLSFGFCTFNGLVLPTGLKKISANIFSESNFLAPVVLPNALEEIGTGAFARATFNNMTLTIPAGVIVDKGAFVYSQINKMVWQGETFDGLGSAPYLLTDPFFLDQYGAIKPIYLVKILDLGTSVPDKYSLSPFRIERLYVHSTTPPAVNGELYYLVHEVQYHYSATLYVPKGCKEIYKNTHPWGTFPKIVEFDETQQYPFVGDVNGDGKVNVSDITALVNHILDGSQQNVLYDDVNEDGKVNVSDVTADINKILGIK